MYAALLLTLQAIASLSCAAADAQSLHKRRHVTFRAPAHHDVIGEEFIRPHGKSQNIELRSKPTLQDACSTSEQVHLTFGEDDGTQGTYGTTAMISFASAHPASGVHISTDASMAGASVWRATPISFSNIFSIAGNLVNPGMGAPYKTAADLMAQADTASLGVPSDGSWTGSTYQNGSEYTVTTGTAGVDYANPKWTYTSPYLFTVTITGLTAGTTYYYTVDGACNTYSFNFPKTGSAAYPQTFGFVADLGITDLSKLSVDALRAMNPVAVLFVGDLSYSDGYGPIWDTFGSMMEPLASKVPIFFTYGNHELGSAENWLPAFSRFPVPYKTSGSTNMCYYGKQVGNMMVVSICSYAGYKPESIQYAWLSSFLNTIDRAITPWVVVMIHAPWYNSNSGHFFEGELLRIAFEPLLHTAGVNMVLQGHVHAYERTVPVYNNEPNVCGQTYITIGDGGNYEAAYVPWRETVGRGINASTWSAFREASFGVASLTLLNDTHAEYSWNRHSCDSGGVASAANNYRQNISAATCVTYGDNSAMAMIAVDSVIITNFHALGVKCPQRRLEHVEESAAPHPVEEIMATPALPKMPKIVFHEETEVIGMKFSRPSVPSPMVEFHNEGTFRLQAVTCTSEQVHTTFGDADNSLTISFASSIAPTSSMFIKWGPDASVANSVSFNAPAVSVKSYSSLLVLVKKALSPTIGAPNVDFSQLAPYIDTTAWAQDPVTGEQYNSFKNYSTVKDSNYNKIKLGTSLSYTNPDAYYESPYLYTYTITGLTAGTTYYYTIDGACPLNNAPNFHVTMPAAVYPMTIGVVGDLGVTQVSFLSIATLAAIPNIQFFLNTGDHSYADGWAPVWDVYGNMLQPLASNIPMMSAGGNHEYANGMEGWLPYYFRYPSSNKGSKSPNPCYFGKVVGKVTILTLCSFAAWESDSIQYKWADQYLATINRESTPWLVVNLHVPWYTSSSGSLYAGELMRRTMEPMLYAAGVNLVVHGHVHVYERSIPSYNLVPDACGPTYITIGDGGNYGGSDGTWTNPAPSWSAFREGSFGVGQLILTNDTSASWTWIRHSCQSAASPTAANNYSVIYDPNCQSEGDNSPYSMAKVDSVIINQLASTCPNYRGKAYPSHKIKYSFTTPGLQAGTVNAAVWINLVALFLDVQPSQVSISPSLSKSVLRSVNDLVTTVSGSTPPDNIATALSQNVNGATFNSAYNLAAGTSLTIPSPSSLIITATDGPTAAPTTTPSAAPNTASNTTSSTAPSVAPGTSAPSVSKTPSVPTSDAHKHASSLWVTTYVFVASLMVYCSM